MPLTAAMAGTAMLFGIAPSLNTTALFALNFMAMGLIQGPIAPAFSQINRTWIPPGIEKVWAFRCIRSVALPRSLDSLLGLFGRQSRVSRPRDWPEIVLVLVVTT